MSLQGFLLFALGLVLVILGAELIVRSAARLAAELGIKPLLIGLTVVALGTSAPEMAVGITAGLEGRGALAVGNIAGANLANILFILGLSAAIRPLHVHLLTIRLDLPAMIGTAILLLLMSWDGHLAQLEGVLLVGCGILYMATMIRVHGKVAGGIQPKMGVHAAIPDPGPGSAVADAAATAVADAAAGAMANSAALPGGGRKTLDLLLLVSGLAVTVAGADVLVDGAVAIAQAFGVTDAIIGLTIVAMGTCAPEFATTMIATLRGSRDVAVGNLIGSCIYNILLILGAACMVSAGGIEVARDILLVDLPLAAVVALVCLPVFSSGRMVTRLEGASFVGCYLAYLLAIVFVRA